MGGKSTGREIMTAGIALAILVISSNVVIPAIAAGITAIVVKTGVSVAVSASALATVGVTSAKIGASCAAAGAGAHAVGWTSVGLAFVAIGLAACTLGLALPKEKSHSFSEKLSKLLIIFFYIGTLLSALSLVLYYLYGENPYIMNICRYLVFIASRRIRYSLSWDNKTAFKSAYEKSKGGD